MSSMIEQQQPTQAAADRTCPLPVVFYDGNCGLCDRSTAFIMNHDRRGQFHIAPLQGPTAAVNLSEPLTQDLRSVVLMDETGVYRHSTAVIRVLWRLGGRWKFAGMLLWLIPRPIRDLGYRLVARYRHRLFPRKAACRMPTPEERRRILP